MRRRFYLPAFMILSTAFVPVLINFGLVVFIVPAGWGLCSMLQELFAFKMRLFLGFAVYSAIYLSIFYAAALVSFRIVSLVRIRALRTALVATILGGLFACSFLKVITYGSIQGRGGTYHFWGAAGRVLEKRAAWR